MVELAGILHPSAFQISELIETLDPAFDGKAQSSFTYKNLELGGWDTPQATNERRTTHALLDGRIFNAASLRSELSKSVRFSGESDAELLVRAYDAWGEAFVEKLHGEFIIVLFDEEKELLYLFRDRIGKKCVYWTLQGNSWLFSTKLRGMIWSGLVPQTLSVSGLATYLHFGFSPQDCTPLKGVNKLLPCHYLKIDLQGRLEIEPYWSLGELYEKPPELTADAAKEHFFQALKRATEASLPGPDSCFLDDGSPASTALTAVLPPGIQHLEPTFPEPQQMLSELVAFVWSLDEPIADLNAVITWSLRHLTTPLITASGWREVLGADPRFTATPPPKPKRHLPDRWVLDLCQMLTSNARWKVLRAWDRKKLRLPYLETIALFSEHDRKRVSPYLRRHFDPNIFTLRFHRISHLEGSLDPLIYFDLKTVVPDAILRQGETLFPTGITTPFVDQLVVECLANIPETLKPDLLQPSVPPPELPEAWRLSKDFRHIFSLLEKGRLVEEGLFSKKWIHNQLGYPFLTQKMFQELWGLLIYEVWFRLFIDRSPGKLDLSLTAEQLLRR